MALLTKEQLQERFRISRERQAKKKEAERKKRKAESDKRRKETMAELNKPKKINLVKLDDEKYIAHRNVGEKTVEGRGYEPYEAVRCNALFLGNLYETREELMEAEKRGEGKLNWEFFNKLVKEVRKELN